MFGNPLLASLGGLRTLTISGTETDLDVHARLGSPTDPQRVVVIIKSSGIVTNFMTGPWAAGSEIKLFNYGYILGRGGDGGQGAGIQNSQAEDGTRGGNAITLETDINIYMQLGSGYIWSGGGGGGGGGYEIVGGIALVGGGGGGGGVSGGLGGSGGLSSSGGTPGPDGEDATTGINATPGDGGVSGISGDGGNGGSWNEGGNVGSGGINPGAGGNAGWAIETNGNSYTFSNVSYPTLIGVGQIKGSIT